MEPHREPDTRTGMGERHVGDGAAPGARPAPAAGRGSGEAPTLLEGAPSDGTSLEGLLAAAMLGRADDRAAETRAVAAFRVARDGGAHTARTRRRDDWRPKEQKGPSRSLRAAFAVLLAGLTLGGVAVAAIGPVTHDDTGHRGGATSRPSGGVPPRLPGAAVPVGPGAPGTPTPSGAVSRPPRAQDIEAHCRAYASVRDRGKALDASSWQRLVTAAGGEDEVEAFCAGQLAARSGTKGAKGTGNAENPENPGSARDAGKPDGTPAQETPAATAKPKGER
ncbi:hypothetical protein [Streptomyces sp. NPDC001914]|uniref:hypothetical protein n=1 Tax=Streptomyces sp. NPDC001914 TaxID=3364623 RepID=UPI0036839FCF